MLRWLAMWWHARPPEQELRLRPKPRPMAKCENGSNPYRYLITWLCARPSLEQAHGEPEDKHVPSKEYEEKKLREVEGGEFRAEQLSQIVSRDEVDPDVLLPVWDSKGHISVKRGSTTVAMPSGPEQLRLRLTVMCNTLVMLKMKHTKREEIQDVVATLFEHYKEYLLGDYILLWPPHRAMDPGPQLRARYPQVCLQASDPRRVAARSCAQACMEGYQRQRAPLHNSASAIC